MRALAARLGRDQEGMTLIELLVAAAMSIVLLGAVVMMLVGAVRSQPQLSERSQNVQTARWVLERVTREIRNGAAVYEASGSQVSFLASVRRTACGGAVEPDPVKPAIQCRVTYVCAAGSCGRRETAPAAPDSGPLTTIVSGLAGDQVFNFSPSAEEPTYIGMTLRIPNPEGRGEMTVSDGASLRTLSFGS